MLLLGFLFITVLATFVAADVSTLWPQPKSVTTGSLQAQLAPDFSIVIDPACSETSILQDVIRQYTSWIFSMGPAVSGSSSIKRLLVCVKDQSTDIQLYTDESYALEVPASGDAKVSAQTYVGAIRGLETFSQLVEFADRVYSIARLPISIKDVPRFAWRGLMFDTSRHYLSPDFIKHIIDSAMMNKLNTLHWHAVDAQSFPWKSEVFPKLSQGAYAPDAVYSLATIQELQRYAQLRGIRLMVEFDIPGHSASWGIGYPEVTSKCPTTNINNINLSPASNLTVPMIQGLIKEAASVLPERYIHVGGDEVVQSCWRNDPAVAAWMAEQGMSTTDVMQYFITAAQQACFAAGRIPVVWQEVFDSGFKFDGRAIVHVWKEAKNLKPVVKAGHRALLSGGWYLDQQVPKRDMKQPWYFWLDTWKDMYNVEPAEGLTSDEAALIAGGAVTMWSEQVDHRVWDERVWPRASAVAERLWSPANVRDILSATDRLDAHSCRMSRRGVRSSPLKPGFCRQPNGSL